MEKKYCGNCMLNCIHAKTKDKVRCVEEKDENGNVWMVSYEHDGYEHFCDKNPEGYNLWHERNKDNPYEVYKEDILECYEPLEFQKTMRDFIDTAESILNSLKEKEDK